MTLRKGDARPMSNAQPTLGSQVGQGRRLWDIWSNRGFVLCAALLVVFVVSFEVIALRSGVNVWKKPLPLKAPLSSLQEAKLAGYRLLRPGTLSADMIDQLGTDEYVQWLLADLSAPDDGIREPRINLFVTYYTGKPDPVPHIPEACYVGSGHKVVNQTSDTVTVSIAGREETVPIRILEFERQGALLDPVRRVVIYTFHANGQFLANRLDVRTRLTDPRTTHAYFSKLELGMEIGSGYASRQDAIEAGKRFLKVAIPVFVEDHWPDWGSVNRASPDKPRPASGPSAERRPSRPYS